MFTISKEFSFCASHQLDNLPKSHPCSNLHGHNYTVIVELQSVTLGKDGMVVDYRKLSFIKDYIDEHLDHRHLNDILEFSPTAENLAKYIFDLFSKTYPQLSAVVVKETPKTAARYSPLFDTKGK
jgi:6-pyruvoyltetrahydropterin/6-carboxytetrahydropterin synthase